MKLKHFQLMLAIIGLILPSVVSAATPEETFTRAVQAMKGAGTLEPLVDYVDWAAYSKKLGSQGRKAMGFSNSGDIRSHYKEIAKSNGEHLLERFKEDVKAETKKGVSHGDVSGSQKVEMVRQELARQQRDLRERIRLSVYTIQGVSGDDKRKTIKFTRSYDGTQSSGSIVLLPSGGGWLFESASALNPLGSAGSSPLGSFPEPVSIFFNP